MIAACAPLFGLTPLFAKALTEAGLSAPAAAFHRFSLSAAALLLVLGPALLTRGRPSPAFGWALLAGAALGVGWIGYVEALKIATVATVGVIYMTYPLFTLLIAWAWFGRRPAPAGAAAGALVLLAAALALGPGVLTGDRGALIAFTSPVAMALTICVLTGKLPGTGLTTLQIVGAISLGAAATLAPLMALAEDAAFPSGAQGWALALGTAVLTALAPNLLFSYAAPHVGPARTAMAGSLELPTVFVMGWLVFAEPLTPAELAAGALVTVAILITPASPAAEAAPSADRSAT